MKDHIRYFINWISASLVLCIFGFAFRNSVVIGNFRLGQLASSIYSGFWITFFYWAMWKNVILWKVKFDPSYLKDLFLVFLNVLGVWLVSRYPDYSGLGITSFWWAIAIGFFIYKLHKMLDRYLEEQLI